MNRELIRLSLLTVMASLVGCVLLAAQTADTKAAQTATEAWLALIDKQNYAASWDAAAAGFRERVTKEQWQRAAQGARASLGPLKSRTLKSATNATNPPGAPAGEYVVLQFDSSFDQKSAAIETVTVVRETDGSWRAVGYFIN
jgi:Protein of unknown function (DUF4019)